MKTKKGAMLSDPFIECRRCKGVSKTSQFNPAFDCCKGCVTVADYDNVQSEVSKIMRGFSAQEKSEIMREAFEANKRRNEVLSGQED